MIVKQPFGKKWFFPLFIIVIIVIIWVGCIWWPCPDREVTTVFLIRHADVDYSIDPSDPDPDLTLQGELRANELANGLSKVEIDAIFSTDTSRTKGTVTPLSVSQGVSITIYGDLDLLVNQIQEDYVGEEVVIVGHSNTVVPTIEKFIGQSTGHSIGPNDFYKIFVLTISESGEWWVVELKYGEVPSS
jgi:2,3-bisphosphoglycerate-dependent phosphoglycerate mutase